MSTQRTPAPRAAAAVTAAAAEKEGSAEDSADWAAEAGTVAADWVAGSVAAD